jgi:hypothetical protein
MGEYDKFKNLVKPALLLVSLAVIVLTGIAVCEIYGDTLKTSTLVSDETLSSVLVGVPESLTYDEIDTTKAFTLYNASDSSDTLTEDTHYSVSYDAGQVTLLAAGVAWNNTDLNATYYYLADTTASGAADNFKTGLAYFAMFVGLLVVALVGKAVIALFRAA